MQNGTTWGGVRPESLGQHPGLCAKCHGLFNNRRHESHPLTPNAARSADGNNSVFHVGARRSAALYCCAQSSSQPRLSQLVSEPGWALWGRLAEQGVCSESSRRLTCPIGTHRPVGESPEHVPRVHLPPGWAGAGGCPTLESNKEENNYGTKPRPGGSKTKAGGQSRDGHGSHPTPIPTAQGLAGPTALGIPSQTLVLVEPGLCLEFPPRWVGWPWSLRDGCRGHAELRRQRLQGRGSLPHRGSRIIASKREEQQKVGWEPESNEGACWPGSTEVGPGSTGMGRGSISQGVGGLRLYPLFPGRRFRCGAKKRRRLVSF